MDYKIISTGSTGNCVIVDDIMFDCGVPMRRIKEELYKINFLFLTHIHTDHINKSTLASIKKIFPHIKVFGNYEVFQSYPEFNIQVINAGFPFKAGNYEVLPFFCVHDVLCYGYSVKSQDQTYLYATDTSSMEHAPTMKYDAIFLESNHDEEKLKQAINQFKGNYNPYYSGKRHLSTKKAKEFFYMNRKNKNSLFVELHQSSRFY